MEIVFFIFLFFDGKTVYYWFKLQVFYKKKEITQKKKALEYPKPSFKYK